MAKGKKNSFEKICDVLEKNYILDENEITYVRRYLVTDLKIGENEDMLLKLKAEAKEWDYGVASTYAVNMLAMLFTAIGVIIQLRSNNMSEFSLSMINIIFLLVIIFALLRTLKFLRRVSRPSRKWRKYVLIVIDQLIDKSSEKKEQNQKTKQKEKQDKDTKGNKSATRRRRR